jgi:hypothetical protein
MSASRSGFRSRKAAGSKLGSFRKKHDSAPPARAAETSDFSVPDGEPKRFRVLVAVHRPRYRARTERAMRGFGWEVRSLLNKEDPVGLIQQKPPNVFIISDDFGRQKDLGILRAVQRFRASSMKIIALFEDAESAEEYSRLCDKVLTPPWKTAEMRENLVGLFREMTGQSLQTACEESDDGTHD